MDELSDERNVKFLSDILWEIRDYALSAGLEPDATLKTVAEWILAILQVATFNERGNNDDK